MIDFIDNLAASMGPEGDCRVEVYVNELNAVQTIMAYLTPVSNVAISTKAYGYTPVFFNVTLKVEER